MMESSLLALVGIDPSLPVTEQAAALVQKIPMRREPASGQRDVASVLESRWFAGPAECHRVLGQLFRGSTGRGSAFSSSWPYLEAAGRVVAPAIPVVAGEAEVMGPDGEYQTADRAVWREAVGERRPVLRLEGEGSSDQPAFDLVWFGATERYLVRQGALEVEDLFSALRLPASRAVIERVLVRGLRVESDVLDGVSFGADQGKAEIEVRRAVDLVATDRWMDPKAVLGERADIATVEGRGDELVATTLAGRTVIFKVVQKRPGWQAFAWEGAYPYQTLTMAEEEGVLSWTAILHESLKPLNPGVRGQLAFDLRSDLIALE